jgi:predicted NACHT family NTPase
MDRVVRDLTHPRKSDDAQLRLFSEYSARVNIVLLGDPGAGKSHLFRTFATIEGGRLVTVRTFLRAPVHRQGEILFIDGLDERRAGRGDRDTVDALMEGLFEAAPAKVRLSCRVADWLGESDLASLRPFFEQSGGEPAVLSLARLRQDEQHRVLSAQNLTAAEANSFLDEAEQRGLGDLLENPQNLLLLLKTVRGGKWPETRKELFELSTGLMLKEVDPDHARKRAGMYSVDELRPAAGAVFAARLISDVEAIGLFDGEGSASVPSYRSMPFLDPDLAHAALTRRVFVAGPEPESVDYAHRTTAEYLGAAWLSQAVRAGLPFIRLQALMGVDGHPAPELRGLHAWLAVHLPEHAARIINTDPYGVLTYGDAASLTRSNCAHLVQALGRLSQTDPWFRHEEWEVPTIGALSRSDMIEEFRSVMRSDQAGFGVRSIVAEALALGMPQPELKADLRFVLTRAQSSYAERLQTVRALLRLGTPGRDALQGAYHKDLGNSADELRLRVEILHAIYDDGFGPADVLTLIEDIWSSPDDLPGGVLWLLSEGLPVGDLATVLDGVKYQGAAGEIARHNAWDIGAFYERTLVRAWKELAFIEPSRAMNWLRLRYAFREGYIGDRNRLAAALKATPERLMAIADHFLEGLDIGDHSWMDLHQFQEMTSHTLGPDNMAAAIMGRLAATSPCTPKRRFLYQAAISFTWNGSWQGGLAAFEQLYNLGEGDEELASIRESMISSKLPERYLGRKLRHGEDDEEGVESRARHRREFAGQIEKIRSGAHLAWLGFLAKIYFGMFTDLDASQAPRQRLAFIVGQEHVAAAMEGLRAILKRSDLPGLNEVVALAAEHRHYEWWYAIIVAMDEQFDSERDLSAFSDDLLSAALVFSLTSPIWEELDEGRGWRGHAWRTAALEKRPELVAHAFSAIASALLTKGAQHVEGLHELMTEEALAPFRAATLLKFLRDFPNASLYRLNEMLDAVLATPEAHAGFLNLAERIARKAVLIDAMQDDQWLATAYLLAPQQFERALEERAQIRPGIIFDLRDLSGGNRYGASKHRTVLSMPQLEFIARLTGMLHPYAPHPSTGSTGDTNPHDAADFFRALVNQISANSSESATAALVRLERNCALSSYGELLLNAKARQLARRREAEYDRPDWSRTIKALANGPPATAADLHALLVEVLTDVRMRIAHTNTDRFKAFWNLDSYARPKDPRPEEACRDTLIDMLRNGLEPLGVTLDPEGHMANDKRADIAVVMPSRRILCELKRDYHRDVWTALDTQLQRLYLQDPASQGFGVYGVFWFGSKRLDSIPPPPGGASRPVSADQMEQMLRALLPPGRSARIAVLVINVSGEIPTA